MYKYLLSTYLLLKNKSRRVAIGHGSNDPRAAKYSDTNETRLKRNFCSQKFSRVNKLPDTKLSADWEYLLPNLHLTSRGKI